MQSTVSVLFSFCWVVSTFTVAANSFQRDDIVGIQILSFEDRCKGTFAEPWDKSELFVLNRHRACMYVSKNEKLTFITAVYRDKGARPLRSLCKCHTVWRVRTLPPRVNLAIVVRSLYIGLKFVSIVRHRCCTFYQICPLRSATSWYLLSYNKHSTAYSK